jgi:DNA-binding SARP family transcriptional activator
MESAKLLPNLDWLSRSGGHGVVVLTPCVGHLTRTSATPQAAGHGYIGSVVEVRLLGPVEASLDGVSVRLRGPKQRSLLAMLALGGNAAVSRDRLIEGLWGLDPPLGVEHALDAQVSSLRQTLAGVGGLEIERRNPGYRVVLSPESVDVRRFDQLVSVGRGLMAQGDPAKAAAILAEALELWHGPALADVQDAPFAAAAAQDLERRRVDALEERVDADLARGCGGELVGDLEVLVREHPFRERLLAALALALYRDGQQARALEVIASARREFAAELGLRPGASLAELESRILNHDPDLMPRGRAASVTSEMARLSSRPRTVQWLTVAVAGLLIVGVLVARGLGVPGHRSASFARGAEGTVLAEAALAGVDLYSGRRGPLVPLSSRPSAVALGAAGVWVSESSEDQVALINPDNNSVLAALAVPGGPGGLTVGDGAARGFRCPYRRGVEADHPDDPDRRCALRGGLRGPPVVGGRPKRPSGRLDRPRHG